ncbi:hypothetical protein PV327_008197 [Microctonus hyperodae]|uniref:Uncharacterized protein n=1 Tax=Microctonus hyperodae TaxID=165561 RepID=A0AA39KGQ6_MICHY|nr:hypothetical protein PV327_008197 [Microctonus hyperodae]
MMNLNNSSLSSITLCKFKSSDMKSRRIQKMESSSSNHSYWKNMSDKNNINTEIMCKLSCSSSFKLANNGVVKSRKKFCKFPSILLLLCILLQIARTSLAAFTTVELLWLVPPMEFSVKQIWSDVEC